MTTSAHLQPHAQHLARRPSKDPAHLPLHRRLLFPYDGLDATLPKLVDGDGPEIDKINERLYHVIALALRAYVLSWYTGISPRDRSLLPSINSTILTPLLRPILTALYHDTTPLVDLILLDLPTILQLHVTTFRQARHQVSLGLGTLGDAYHARLPLMSVEKVGEKSALSPLYLTSLADGILKNGLSVKEYGSTVERLMARELVGRMILMGVGKRLSEDWFWYSLLLKLLGDPDTESVHSTPIKGTLSDRADRAGNRARNILDTITSWTTKIWTAIMLCWTSILTMGAFYSGAPVPKQQYQGCAKPWLSLLATMIGHDSTRDTKPILARLLLGSLDCISSISSPFMSRMIPHYLETRILTPQTSLKVIDLLERILFPLDGYPAPTPPDPNPEEISDMRLRLEKRLDGMLPDTLESALAPGGAAELLDVLSSAECNAHLVGMVLDTAVAALVPDIVIEAR